MLATGLASSDAVEPNSSAGDASRTSETRRTAGWEAECKGEEADEEKEEEEEEEAEAEAPEDGMTSPPPRGAACAGYPLSEPSPFCQKRCDSSSASGRRPRSRRAGRKACSSSWEVGWRCTPGMPRCSGVCSRNPSSSPSPRDVAPPLMSVAPDGLREGARGGEEAACAVAVPSSPPIDRREPCSEARDPNSKRSADFVLRGVPAEAGARKGGSPASVTGTCLVMTSDASSTAGAIASPHASTGTPECSAGAEGREARQQSAREQNTTSRYIERPCSTTLYTHTTGGSRNTTTSLQVPSGAEPRSSAARASAKPSAAWANGRKSWSFGK
mmetsp:Transcript_30756/g.96254  ORF Transcript_30756/g.96254 Transcript_30756/m.96254 type:complete len:329 (-) Transcript_30756:1170-2156(-)